MTTIENPSPVYADFVSTVGRESPLAEAQVSRLLEALCVSEVPDLDSNAFFHAQDKLYDQKDNGEITQDELLDGIKALSKRSEAAYSYRSALDRLNAFPTIARIDNYADADTMTAVSALLGRLRAPNKVTNQAPLSDYAENTDEAWKWVKDAHIRDFLQSKVFVDDADLYDVTHPSIDSNTHLMRRSASVPNFSVPTDLVVNAMGFSSWLGREDEAGRKGMGEKFIALNPTVRSVSYTAIKAYAGHPTKLPPVTKFDVFIQPNGLAFASNGGGGGDSHRIAATMLRGEKTVESERLGIVLLRDNLLETLIPTPNS